MDSSIKCLVYKDCDTDLVSVVLKHKVLQLYSCGWLGTGYINQTGPSSWEICLPLPPVLGLYVYTIMPRFIPFVTHMQTAKRFSKLTYQMTIWRLTKVKRSHGVSCQCQSEVVSPNTGTQLTQLLLPCQWSSLWYCRSCLWLLIFVRPRTGSQTWKKRGCLVKKHLFKIPKKEREAYVFFFFF